MCGTTVNLLKAGLLALMRMEVGSAVGIG